MGTAGQSPGSQPCRHSMPQSTSSLALLPPIHKAQHLLADVILCHSVSQT